MSLGSMVPWGRRGALIGPSTEASPFLSLRREMERMFDDFLGDSATNWGWPTTKPSTFNPRVTVAESEKEMTVTAELPGLTEKDLECTLQGDHLLLRGTKREEREEKEGGKVVFSERSYGMFERAIPLSCEVVDDKIDASFKNGVLTIRLPKTPESACQTKRISVRAA